MEKCNKLISTHKVTKHFSNKLLRPYLFASTSLEDWIELNWSLFLLNHNIRFFLNVITKNTFRFGDFNILQSKLIAGRLFACWITAKLLSVVGLCDLGTTLTNNARHIQSVHDFCAFCDTQTCWICGLYAERYRQNSCFDWCEAFFHFHVLKSKSIEIHRKSKPKYILLRVYRMFLKTASRRMHFIVWTKKTLI
jgi:hypothetical protein